jgi:hypothetical protein
MGNVASQRKLRHAVAPHFPVAGEQPAKGCAYATAG